LLLLQLPQLLHLCLGTFICFGATFLFIKYFSSIINTHSRTINIIFISLLVGVALLTASTIGVLFRWHKIVERISFKSNVKIIISGVCTGIIVSLFLLMYSYNKISAMLASIVMCALVILSGKVANYFLVLNKIIKKLVTKRDNMAIIFSFSAVLLNIINDLVSNKNCFSFYVILILIAYFLCFTLRIYMINSYKNLDIIDSTKTVQYNKYFFIVERLYALIAVVIIFFIIATILYLRDKNLMLNISYIIEEWKSVTNSWIYAIMIIVGTIFGIGTIFSVSILLYRRFNATMTVLINRSIILLAGIFVTILLEVCVLDRNISIIEYISVGLLIISFYYSVGCNSKFKETD
jgi:hypothetical protein